MRFSPAKFLLRKQTWLLLLLLVCATEGFAQTTNQTPREQVLKLLQGVHSTTNLQASMQQIKSIGSNAVPVLIEVLGYRQPKLDEWYEQAYRKVPALLQEKMSKPDVITKLRSLAARALHMMPETKDYLQDLLPLLKDERVEVRRDAVNVFSTHSVLAQPAVMLELIPLLKDADPDVQRYTIRALHPHILTLPRAKAAMETVLQDNDEMIRMEAAQKLLFRERDHEEALMVVRSSLRSSNSTVCLMAANSLLVAQRKSPTLDSELGPVFTRLLSSTNSSTQLSSLRQLYLNGRGKSLHSIMPEVQKLLTNANPKIRGEAIDAYWALTNNVFKP